VSEDADFAARIGEDDSTACLLFVGKWGEDAGWFEGNLAGRRGLDGVRSGVCGGCWLGRGRFCGCWRCSCRLFGCGAAAIQRGIPVDSDLHAACGFFLQHECPCDPPIFGCCGAVALANDVAWRESAETNIGGNGFGDSDAEGIESGVANVP
jgi:hypothetical protein